MYIIINNRGERLWQFGPYDYYEIAHRVLNNNEGRGFHIAEISK